MCQYNRNASNALDGCKRLSLLAVGLFFAAGMLAPSIGYAQTATTNEVGLLKQQMHKMQEEIDKLQRAQQLPASHAPMTTQGERNTTEKKSVARRAMMPVKKQRHERFSLALGNGASVALHGWIDATGFWQDRNFGPANGQGAEFPKPGKANKGSLSGFDVRNTRLWLTFHGPRLSSTWTTGGRFEFDLNGGFHGNSGSSSENINFRLRQAFILVKNTKTRTSVKIGQQWNLMTPVYAPVSLTHIFNGLGIISSFTGTRYPGVVVTQNLSGSGKHTPQWDADMGVFTGNWNGPGNNNDFNSAGNAHFHPQLEARVRMRDGGWRASLMGHYSREDLSGVNGLSPTPIKNGITSWAVEGSAGWQGRHWTLRGAVYTGNADTMIAAAMGQYGDIPETGAWAQIGYKFTPHWGLYGFSGWDWLNQSDVATWTAQGTASGRVRSRINAVDLIYRIGPFGAGLEWMHSVLHSIATPANPLPPGVVQFTSGNQVSLSAIYHF